jgi:segregation and condensation protein A
MATGRQKKPQTGEGDEAFPEEIEQIGKAKKKAAKAEQKEEAELQEENEPGAKRMETGDMKLEKIVALPTWREILLDLVATKQLDPWNIDIIQITEGYMERIRKIEMHDLRVPANLILAAAILLRFKSAALRFEEEAQVVEDQTYVDEDSEPSVIPVLELKTRIPPTRMVTLDELLVAMEKVFQDQKKREEKSQKIEIPTVINIQLPEFNMEQRMEELYKRVREGLDSEGLATFSNILPERTPVAMIMTLLPLLHLVQDRKLSIFQEQFFGEIFIRVKEDAAPDSGSVAQKK